MRWIALFLCHPELSCLRKLFALRPAFLVGGRPALQAGPSSFMVERNMCNAVMRGIIVPPGRPATPVYTVARAGPQRDADLIMLANWYYSAMGREAEEAGL
jgi:hypothetical protein